MKHLKQLNYSISNNKLFLFNLTLVLFLLGTQQSCLRDDFFGLSPYNDILSFQLPGQSGLSQINTDTRTITIAMPAQADLTAIVPLSIEISNLATIQPGTDVIQNFSEPVIYTVTAEDGTNAIWTINTETAQSNPQLPNSNFDLWYAVSDYWQPGQSSQNTVWDTANRGVAIAGDANTVREDLGNGDFAVKMTSVAAPLVVRMAAATLFTGKFTSGFPSVTNPRSNIDFGTPFSGRPTAFKIDYRYIPGASYEDANGNTLSGSDQCDMYILLQQRDGDVVQRIGTGWFRNATAEPSWTTIEVPIKYRQLTADDPEFEYANIRTDEGEVWGNPQATPTHIVVVFSSSALGDSFTGAIGSELWLNNLELIY